MSRYIKWLLIVNISIVAGLYLLGYGAWILSFELAFISSTLVLGASMFSHSAMVHKRLASGDVGMADDRDTLEKLEDPHDLYSDDEIVSDEHQSLKEEIKEQKKLMKKNRRSFMQVMRDSRGSFAFLRLVAYLILFLGFFYLSRGHILQIPAYLVGLTLPIVTILTLLINTKELTDEARL